MRPMSATKRPQSATTHSSSRSKPGTLYSSSNSGSGVPYDASSSPLHSVPPPPPSQSHFHQHQQQATTGIATSSSSTLPPNLHSAVSHHHHHPPQIPVDILDKISATGCGAVVVAAVAVRRFNASPNTMVEYVATLTVGERTITTEPIKAVHDFVSGGWTLTFRDVHAIFPIDAQYDGRLGVVVSVHSTCCTLHFGSATCRTPREWCALSRPRGEVQVSFHEIYPHLVAAAPSSSSTAQHASSSGKVIPPPPLSMRMTPLIARPNTASVLGRAPLTSNSSSSGVGLTATSASVNSSGGAAGRGKSVVPQPRAQPPPPPQGPLGATPPTSPQRHSVPKESSASDGLSSVAARAVVMSDWAIDDLPPPSPSGFGGAVYLVIRFAHSEHRLPPALVCTHKPAGRDPELDGRTAAQRAETVLSKVRAAGLTSSDDDDDDGDSDCNDRRVTGRSNGPREARWPNRTTSFDIPLLLQEPVAVISVYLCDFRNPEGGRLLAEATCPVDIGSPTAGTRVARRVVFTGEVKLTAMFTAQVEFHEARREGAGGRPTSAFPRRAPTGLSPSSSGNFHAPPNYASVEGTSSSPLQSLSGRQNVSPIADAPQQLSNGRPMSASGRGQQHRQTTGNHADHRQTATPIKDGATHDASLDAEELPVDDFVRDDDDDDDDDVIGSRDQFATTGTRGGGGATSFPAAHSDVPSEALDALAAAFQVRLRQVLTASFQVVVDRMESIERRVALVEERVLHQVESTGGGGEQRMHTPPPASLRPQSAGGGSGVGGRGSHQNHSSVTSAVPTAAIAPMASGGSASLSRPNSGESYRGAGLYDRGSFPEHANPLYSDALLRQKFATYDNDASGYLTKAQLVHFYRTHNSFSVDETNDDVEAELRRFAPHLDDDAVTFDEFSLVALRLAKF